MWNKIFGLEATFSIAVEDHQNVSVQKLKTILTTQKRVLYFNYSHIVVYSQLNFVPFNKIMIPWAMYKYRHFKKIVMKYNQTYEKFWNTK